MKIYTVYHNPNAKSEEESIVLVAEDFNWWCFFFPLNIIWALRNRAWLFLLICITAFTVYVSSYISPYEASEYVNITKLPVQMFLGIFANDFLRLSLRHRGYHFAGLISGKNEDEALRNYLLAKYS